MSFFSQLKAWHKKGMVLLLISVFLGCISFAAFATPPQYTWRKMDTSKYKKPRPWKIGFSNASLTNSWRVFYLAEIKYEFSRFPEVTFYYTDANESASKQVSDIEDLVAKGIDLLLVDCVNPEAVTPICMRLMNQGIPVVTCSRGLADDRAYVTYVESNVYEMGKAQAEWLVKELKGKGKIVMLGGMAGATAAEDRIQGALDVFKKYPDIKVQAIEYCDWSPVKGKRIMADLIVKYPDLDGVWSGSGLQGSGAVEAFLDAGKFPPPISGEDFNRFLKQWKRIGFKGVSVSNPVWQGAIAARLCTFILDGVPVPHYVDTGRTIITEKELDTYVRMDKPDDFWVDNHLPEELLPR